MTPRSVPSVICVFREIGTDLSQKGRNDVETKKLTNGQAGLGYMILGMVILGFIGHFFGQTDAGIAIGMIGGLFGGVFVNDPGWF